MLAYKETTRRLRVIFEKVVPGERAMRPERYIKVAKALMPGKKHEVNDLIKEILKQL